MKKILCVIFILNTYLLYAIGANICVGIQNKQTNYYKHPDFYITLNIWQDIYKLRIYGSIENEFSHIGDLRFRPQQDYYTIGASYDFSFAKIKLEHACYHPVMSWYRVEGINGGYTKFEVTIGD